MFTKTISISILFLFVMLTGTVSAHTGIASDSIIHSVLHVLSSISILLVLAVIGLIAYKRIPKFLKQRVK